MKRAKKPRRTVQKDLPTRGDDTIDSKAKIDALAWKARLAIKLVAGILALFFTWIKFSGTSLLPVLESTEPEVLTKVIAVFYYLCWLLGTDFDVGTQQSVYISDPKQG